MAPNPLSQAVPSSQQATDTSPLPPYTTAESNTSHAEIPGSLECPNDWQTRDYNLTFTLAPTFAGIERAELPWKAFLSLKVKHLPDFMKRGFYWSEANLQKRPTCKRTAATSCQARARQSPLGKRTPAGNGPGATLCEIWGKIRSGLAYLRYSLIMSGRSESFESAPL